MKYRSILLSSIFYLLSSPFVFSAEPAYYDYLRGMLEERAGNFQKALTAYEKTVAQDPEAVEVYRDIAQVNLRLGKTDAALRAAEKIRELAPKDAMSFIFLGNVQVAQGNLAQAADAYEKALALEPENLRALENLGNYYAIMDPEKALGFYDRYLTLEPGDAEMHFQRGMVLHKAGRTPDAIKSFETALRYDPRQSAPHLALAEMYDTEHSTASAIAEFEKAAEIQPGHPLIHNRLGHLYYGEKNLDKAAENFEKVLETQPKDPTVHYWLSRVREDQEKWDQAASHAEKAYTLSRDPQFLPLLAYFLTLNHQPAEAIKWLEKARSADPKNANVHLFLGINYLEIGKTEKAVDALKKGTALAPSDPQLRFQLGVALDRAGRFAEAVADFKKVLELDPENAAAMNYLGYTWADKGENLAEAETLLRKAVAMDPENGAYLDSLGWVRYKQGDYREAVSWLEKAAERSRDPLIYDHLGDAYRGAGQSTKALDAWKNAITLDPALERVREKMNDQSQRVTPGSDPRKLLKTVEGNFRQMADLRSRMRATGKLKKASLKIQGLFFYQKPDRLMVQLPGDSNRPDIRVVMKGSTITLEPAEWTAGVNPEALKGLSALPDFFSGRLAQALDQESVRTRVDKSIVRYEGETSELWIDAERAVITRVIRRNPEGGRDQIDIEAYEQVEGLWIPTRLRLRNSARGLDARVTFSEWVINHPATGKVFR